MDESINTANEKQSRKKPPLSVVRITGEIVAGTVLGLVGRPIAYVAGTVFGGDCTGSWAGLIIFILVFPTLCVIGSAVGVYLVGNIGKQTGSFILTLGGGILGGLVMFLLFWKELLSLTGEKIVTLGLILLIAPIIATLGFNLTRRYKEPASS